MAALANILDHPDALRRIAQSSRPGLALDFDGTLSEIAPTPEAAVIHPRCADALRRAVGKFAVVAVVSGRAARDLARRVDVPGAVCVGNHGAERVVGGACESAADTSGGGAESVSRALDAVRRATAQIGGLVYEDKGFSASVHYRAAADPESARRELRRALAGVPNADGVESFWGKMVLELRPARAPNKGDALAALVAEYRLDALAFAGDDTTDVDAMRRLRALGGIAALGIAVVSDADAAPPALLETADYAANGAAAVGAMLAALAVFRDKRWE